MLRILWRRQREYCQEVKPACGSHPSVHPMSPHFQTIQALDDMLQALVIEDMRPNMAILQSFLEVSGCRNQKSTLFRILHVGRQEYNKS